MKVSLHFDIDGIPEGMAEEEVQNFLMNEIAESLRERWGGEDDRIASVLYRFKSGRYVPKWSRPDLIQQETDLSVASKASGKD